LEQVLTDLVQKTANKVLSREAVGDVLLALREAYGEPAWKETMEIVFRSCFVLILAKRSPELLLNNVQDLLQEFPEFCGFSTLSGCSENELVLLLKFRNMMECGIRLFSAAGNKGKLMDIAGLLSGKLVTTGGGSGIEAKRREAIYEKLGGVTKKKVTVPRQRKGETDQLQGRQLGQVRGRGKDASRLAVRSARRLVAKHEPAPIGGGPMALSLQNPSLMQVESAQEPVAQCGYDAENHVRYTPTAVGTPRLMAFLVDVITPLAPASSAGSGRLDCDALALLLQEPVASKDDYCWPEASLPASSPASPRHPAHSPIDSDGLFLPEDNWDDRFRVESPAPLDAPPPSLKRGHSLTLDLWSFTESFGDYGMGSAF
jgi:hypothetical protein